MGQIHLETNLEFNQNKIKTLNKKLNVDMYHAKFRGGKAFATDQKIREFKKLLWRSKCFDKIKKKRIRPLQLIKNAAENMNTTSSVKYGISPENMEKKKLKFKFMNCLL